jgi:hypothetical protein
VFFGRRAPMSKRIRACILALVSSLWSLALGAQESTGTLVLDVKPFTSQVKLKEKVENQLKTGGIEWGAAEGQLVVSLVNKRFIRFELPHLTRYGEKKTLELEPGTYRLTCVGFVPEGGLSVEKALKKGAYFNIDTLTFQVAASRTTTIEVEPTIRKESTFFLKFYIPELLVRVIEDGSVKSESVINNRTDKSVAWEDYKGPLKF